MKFQLWIIENYFSIEIFLLRFDEILLVNDSRNQTNGKFFYKDLTSSFSHLCALLISFAFFP